MATNSFAAPPRATPGESSSPQVGADGRAWLAFVLTAIGVVALDQASKMWAVVALTDLCRPEGAALGLADKLARFWWTAHPSPEGGATVFGSWWHFYYVENPGAAWGFLSRSSWAGRTAFFVALAFVAMVFLLNYFRRTAPRERLLRFGLAIVFGGAIGNLIDRVRLGYVIDFIDWHLGATWHWPTFNVADAAISCGVALLLLDVSRPKAAALARGETIDGQRSLAI